MNSSSPLCYHAHFSGYFHKSPCCHVLYELYFDYRRFCESCFENINDDFSGGIAYA